MDRWLQTSIAGMHAVGEAAGTHGAYHPGGSALNVGQIGAMHAACHIAHTRNHSVTKTVLDDDLLSGIDLLSVRSFHALIPNTLDVGTVWRKKMSLYARTMRNHEGLSKLYNKLTAAYCQIGQFQISGTHERYMICRALDTVIAQMAMVFAPSA